MNSYGVRILIALGILCVANNTQAWVIKEKKEMKCTDWVSPESVMKNYLTECTKISETKHKVILDCKSKTPVLNGVHEIYPTLSDCESDGGVNETEKHRTIRENLENQYNSQLWYKSENSCSKKVLECSLLTTSVKQFISKETAKYNEKGYRCANAFDLAFASQTPKEPHSLFLSCMDSVTPCITSFNFFSTESECKSHKYN